MVVRGIRGAITVEENTRESILEATREVFAAVVKANNVTPEQVAFIQFATTVDLNADFPAEAVRRQEGWQLVPLLCGHEMDVAKGLGKCIRILVTVNTEASQEEIEHVYLRGAKVLRLDLAKPEDGEEA